MSCFRRSFPTRSVPRGASPNPGRHRCSKYRRLFVPCSSRRHFSGSAAGGNGRGLCNGCAQSLQFRTNLLGLSIARLRLKHGSNELRVRLCSTVAELCLDDLNGLFQPFDSGLINIHGISLGAGTDRCRSCSCHEFSRLRRELIPRFVD